MLLFILTVQDRLCRLHVFKYISCYCLSAPQGGNTPGLFKIQIHLMLLFIPPEVVDQNGNPNSNTSHVIVYQDLEWNRAIDLCIQIHLMLLFIYYDGYKWMDKYLFKYISCYCLSDSRLISGKCYIIQIHLMLLFIERELDYSFRVGIIQIHLMLLFILASLSFPPLPVHSNTSHVIVYLTFLRLF